MSHYRRWYVPGGTTFFTLVTYKRQPLFADPGARELLGQAMRSIRDVLPFENVALVLLPDHLHAIWTLPPGDADYSKRWKRIKAKFTVDWQSSGGIPAEVSLKQAARGSVGVWQRRFHEHQLRDERDLEQHCDYIHYNPVKHGLAMRPWDWPASTFRRFVALGQYDAEWGRTLPPNLNGLDFE